MEALLQGRILSHFMSSHVSAKVVSGRGRGKLVLWASGSMSVSLGDAECDAGRSADALSDGPRDALVRKPAGPQGREGREGGGVSLQPG